MSQYSLFIYGLFNDDVNSSDYTVLKNMTDK